MVSGYVRMEQKSGLIGFTFGTVGSGAFDHRVRQSLDLRGFSPKRYYDPGNPRPRS